MPPSGRESETSTEAFAIYLKQVRQYDLLTAVQEVELAQCIEEGKVAKQKLKEILLQDTPTEDVDTSYLEEVVRAGDEARQAFINANLRLVISIAKNRHRPGSTGVDFLDAVQAGNDGLIRAVEKFDWRKGFKFSTYATWWITQTIGRSYFDHAKTIRLPVHVADKLDTINKATEAFLKMNGESPNIEQLAEETGFEVNTIMDILGNIHTAEGLVSLDAPIGDDEISLGSFVEDRSVNVEGHAVENLASAELINMLSILSEKEQTVVVLRFGLDGGDERTLEQIGQELGITRERVRQLVKKAIEKLQEQPSLTNDLRDTA